MRNPVRSLPIRTLSLLLTLGWLAPGSAAATPALMVAISGTDLVTGDSFSEGENEFQVGGELHRSAPLGPFGAFDGGPAFSEGYASESGTFWGSVTTGFRGYDASSVVLWAETYVKQSATDTVEAEITGGKIVLTDFGGDPSIDFLGMVSFTAFVDHPNVTMNEFEHVAEVTGVSDNWLLSKNSGDLAVHTDFTTMITLDGGPKHDTAIWTLEPVTIFFDLSDVPVGESFGVAYRVEVRARGRGGETIASAYFRDPVSMTGGITVTPRGPIPVPEPGTLGLAAIGLVALALRRARRFSAAC